MRVRPYDIMLIWLIFFGVWPFADPGHELDTIGSVLDIIIHGAALGLLHNRWRISFVRRMR